jgi:hypothetical protein
MISIACMTNLNDCVVDEGLNCTAAMRKEAWFRIAWQSRNVPSLQVLQNLGNMASPVS